MCIADLLVNIANKLSSKLKAINASLANKGQTEAESFDDVPAKIDAISSEPVDPELQNKTITPTKSEQVVSADSGYDGLGTVTVDAIPDAYIIPSGTTNLVSNGTFDVTKYASATVSVDDSCEYIVMRINATLLGTSGDYVSGIKITNDSINDRIPSELYILLHTPHSSYTTFGLLSYANGSGQRYNGDDIVSTSNCISMSVSGNTLTLRGNDFETFYTYGNYYVILKF